MHTTNFSYQAPSTQQVYEHKKHPSVDDIKSRHKDVSQEKEEPPVSFENRYTNVNKFTGSEQY